ncbi:hypothetical protein V2J09_021317 [Rumex salicifolius]
MRSTNSFLLLLWPSPPSTLWPHNSSICLLESLALCMPDGHLVPSTLSSAQVWIVFLQVKQFLYMRGNKSIYLHRYEMCSFDDGSFDYCIFNYDIICCL